MVVAQCLQTERCSEISSSPCYSCAMMGLQATAGKRKLEGGGVGCMDFEMDLGESPTKLSRMEASWWTIEDHHFGSGSPTSSASYFDLEISTPACLQSASSDSTHLAPASPTSGSPSPVVSSSGGQSPASQSPAQQQQQYYQQRPPTTYQHHQHHQQQAAAGQQQLFRWHYEPPTIRREENGKSYLELGSSSYRATASAVPQGTGGSSGGTTPATALDRCCEGARASWCRRSRTCYRQSRLAVVNISMCKLARYRQFPDPSLHRSVLICNTLRYLEREMERDRSPPPPPTPADSQTTTATTTTTSIGHQQQQHQPSPTTTATTTTTSAPGPHLVPPPQLQHHHHHHHHHLQPPEHGRLTPFPMSSSALSDADVDSGLGDSDDGRSINWGSVLSLSSQSPLDPLNNNELLDVDIGPEFELDFMPSWKPLAPAASPVAADDPTHQHQQQQQRHLEHDGSSQASSTCGSISSNSSSCSSSSNSSISNSSSSSSINSSVVISASSINSCVTSSLEPVAGCGA